MRTILMVEDESIIRVEIRERLEDAGFDVVEAATYQEGEALIGQQDFYCYFLDNNLQGVSGEGLWKIIRRKNSEVPIVFCTSYDKFRDSRISADKNTHILIKPFSDGELIRRLRSLDEGLASLNVFIVHGTDLESLSELEEFVASQLGLSNRIVLQRTAGLGATIVEKFEAAADEVDACIVLITPDDINVSGPRSRTRRMRQNVLFELGFFMGRFGRKSGRVIVLLKGDVELPSDLNGVDFIRVTGKFADLDQSLVRQIRQRLLTLRP